MDECNTRFKEIIRKCEKIESTIEKLEKKMKELQQKFQSASNHDLNPLLIYSLDSVFFQFYVCNIQKDNFLQVFHLIQNHIYCDLFKLHRILCDYVQHNIQDKKINALLNVGNYPVYKDLEKYKVYDREKVVQVIFKNITSIINAIQEHCKHDVRGLKQHKESIKNGFHYDKLLQTFHFNNRVVEEQLSLFSNFLKYSCNYHDEFLGKVYQKIYDLYYEIPPLFSMGNYKKKEIQMKNSEINFNDDMDIDNENVGSNDNQNDIIGDIQLENNKVNYVGDDENMSLFDENSDNNMEMIQDQSSITQDFFIANNNANDFIPPTSEDDNTSVVSSISASSTKKKRGRPKKNKN
jgi:hypothetical protein